VTTLDRARLRALTLPVEEIATRELVWQLRGSCGARWSRDGDESPIDVTIHGGRWLVLDGADRLRRAVALDVPTVAVRKVPTWALPLILVAS
jgi:hypothetical protein